MKSPIAVGARVSMLLLASFAFVDWLCNPRGDDDGDAASDDSDDAGDDVADFDQDTPDGWGCASRLLPEGT